MLLQTATATKVKRGYYFVQIAMTAGTTAVTISVEGLTAIAITDFAKSAAAYFYISLPDCVLTATLTGDAKIALSPVAVDTR